VSSPLEKLLMKAPGLSTICHDLTVTNETLLSHLPPAWLESAILRIDNDTPVKCTIGGTEEIAEDALPKLFGDALKLLDEYADQGNQIGVALEIWPASGVPYKDRKICLSFCRAFGLTVFHIIPLQKNLKFPSKSADIYTEGEEGRQGQRKAEKNE